VTPRRETALFFAGIAAVVAGLWMAWPPAAPIVAGAACCAIAWVSAGMPRKKP
jgi:hypothetical protein